MTIPIKYFIIFYVISMFEIYSLCQLILISISWDKFLVTGHSLEAFFKKSIVPLEVLSGIFIPESTSNVTIDFLKKASKECPVTRNLSQEIDIKISWHNE